MRFSFRSLRTGPRVREAGLLHAPICTPDPETHFGRDQILILAGTESRDGEYGCCVGEDTAMASRRFGWIVGNGEPGNLLTSN